MKTAKTAMQELKEKTQIVVDDLKDAVPGTDQYGYRSAMQCVINEIDVVMLAIEKRQIMDSYSAGYTTWDENNQCQKEAYYTQTFTP